VAVNQRPPIKAGISDCFFNFQSWDHCLTSDQAPVFLRLVARYVPFCSKLLTYSLDNFPSYTSGHSTQSGAAASLLTDMFGAKKFRDTTHIDHALLPPQEPRTFESFSEAAAEAAVSRLYGGIHYRFDNDDGLASGECIGQAIQKRVSFKIGYHKRNPTRQEGK
jgi:PAP2 superfamily